jgi:serine/threonine protein kinase
MKIGTYEVQQKLAEGGMGIVYKAWDPELKRLVALKEMGSHLDADPDALEAFQNEASLLASMRHPNIVAVWHSIQDEGKLYLVMEYVEGKSLQDIIREGPTEIEKALKYLEQILKALKEMHAKGIVHQDIKPGNILVDAEDNIKITDFGLARRAGEEGPRLDWGSVKYMAPELLEAQDSDSLEVPDPRVDIYALGIVVYEMLLGDAQFRKECQEIYSESSREKISARWANWHLDRDRKLRLLCEVDPKISRDLSEGIQRMMSKDLGVRYQSVDVILEEIQKGWRSERTADDLDPDRTAPRPGAKAKGKASPKAATSAPKAAPSASKEAASAPKEATPAGKIPWLWILAALSVTLSVAGFLLLSKGARSVPCKITSLPGAAISIDGKPAKPMPSSGVLEGTMPTGSHTIKISMKAGYEPFDGTLEAKPSGTCRLDAVLKPATAATPQSAVRAEMERLAEQAATPLACQLSQQVYALGDNTAMTCTAPEAGYLQVISYGMGDEKAALLFPNKKVPNSAVKAGQVQIPPPKSFVIYNALPAGMSQQEQIMLVLFTKQPLNLGSPSSAPAGFLEVPEQALRDLKPAAPYGAAKLVFQIRK